MKLKATIKPIYVIEVEGKVIGEFEEISSWEGMVKLKSEKGIIIAHKGVDDAGVFSSFFNSLNSKSNETELVPIKATPGLLDEFHTKPQ